ncbi:unnamed protein product [Fasciola hepatica]|uniref:Uncharacterized protein n=1 Tax=Fasciola hepatica TaxID=6192 RepID=A0ABC9HI61_FASHE
MDIIYSVDFNNAMLTQHMTNCDGTDGSLTRTGNKTLLEELQSNEYAITAMLLSESRFSLDEVTMQRQRQRNPLAERQSRYASDLHKVFRDIKNNFQLLNPKMHQKRMREIIRSKWGSKQPLFLLPISVLTTISGKRGISKGNKEIREDFRKMKEIINQVVR